MQRKTRVKTTPDGQRRVNGGIARTTSDYDLRTFFKSGNVGVRTNLANDVAALFDQVKFFPEYG